MAAEMFVIDVLVDALPVCKLLTQWTCFVEVTLVRMETRKKTSQNPTSLLRQRIPAEMWRSFFKRRVRLAGGGDFGLAA